MYLVLLEVYLHGLPPIEKDEVKAQQLEKKLSQLNKKYSKDLRW